MGKETFTGISEDQLGTAAEASLKAAMGKQEEPETETIKAPPEQKEEVKVEEGKTEKADDGDKGQDANSKYDNILINTFGYEEGDITDRERKLAKSWAEIQSVATKSKQQSSQQKQLIDNLNTTLEKYPSLYEQLQKAAKGEYQENPKQESVKADQPIQTGQLDTEISEAELVKKGYLTADALSGLDELAKQRKLLRAEAKYIREQESQKYFEDIQTQQKKLRSQQELSDIETENERRVSEGFDRFVAQTGVNFAELDDTLVSQIQKRVLYTRDPDDPRKIADDAFELVASQVLSKNGLMPQKAVQGETKKIDQIEDTGKSFTKQTQSKKKPSSMAEELQKRSLQEFQNSTNPKDKYRHN